MRISFSSALVVDFQMFLNLITPNKPENIVYMQILRSHFSDFVQQLVLENSLENNVSLRFFLFFYVLGLFLFLS